MQALAVPRSGWFAVLLLAIAVQALGVMRFVSGQSVQVSGADWDVEPVATSPRVQPKTLDIVPPNADVSHPRTAPVASIPTLTVPQVEPQQPESDLSRAARVVEDGPQVSTADLRLPPIAGLARHAAGTAYPGGAYSAAAPSVAVAEPARDQQAARRWPATPHEHVEARSDPVVDAPRGHSADVAETRSMRALLNEEWIRGQSPRNYTLQVQGGVAEEDLSGYAGNDAFPDPIAAYVASRRKARPLYAVVVGTYPTVRAAKEAAAEIAPSVPGFRPWVRRFGEIIHQIEQGK